MLFRSYLNLTSGNLNLDRSKFSGWALEEINRTNAMKVNVNVFMFADIVVCIFGLPPMKTILMPDSL